MNRRVLFASTLPALCLLACGPHPTPPAQTTGSGEASASNGAADTGPDPAGGDSEDATPPVLEPIAPEGEHAFSVLDMLEVDRVSSPALASDGSKVAYVLRETDMQANRGRTSLWLQHLDGQPARRLDAHPKGASQPTWGPDDEHLYFVSSRSGSSQVWRMTIADDSVTTEQVTDLPVSVTNLRVGPDGRWLVVTADLFPDCPDLACTAARLEAREADARTGFGYDRMFVRHWDTWKDGRRSTLLAASIPAAGRPPTPDSTILSGVLDADVPSKPFGGSEDIVISPDGNGVVFSARDAQAGGGEPWSTNFDLYYVHLPGYGGADAPVPTKLTTNPAWDAQPQFSPDGSQLAWLAMARPGYEADRFALTIQDWSGSTVTGEPRVVTDDWDRSIAEFTFVDDARVLAIAQNLGHKSLFSVDLASGAATPLVETGTLGSVGAAGDRAVWVQHDLGHPAELFTGSTKVGETEAAALSHHNDALMARAKVGEAEQFTFTGANGDTVYGWVVKPVDFDPAKTYPVAFLIHGGPQGSFGNKFHHRWNPQAYAGAGYAAVMIDFHGSTGYGQAFTDAIGQDWGGKPLEDLQLGLAHAVDTYPWLNGDQVCALGASYGGFMINWIAGNWPDRFQCLVNHDGIFDQRMMYYATEELWFPEWEHGGPEFDTPEAYARFNPVDHVKRWQTPMLVVHGSLDYRVPLEQGLATFTALQRRGIESRLLHFPDENHWVLSPANSVQWHEEVLGWLDAHLE